MIDLEFLHKQSLELRPKSLVIDDQRWKFLVRSVMRGKNLMITGPAGSGKTLSIQTVASALDRKLFTFNLGATQDPRSSLIGNTHFAPESGTFFAQSEFVTAIQTPNAVVLLDELSRAHPEAWNILMTVLDEKQRYMRLDEAPNSPIIQVANGVSFLATANIGMEYTSTRVIDRAIADRFEMLEMPYLTKDQQQALIKLTYPTIDDEASATLANLYQAFHENVSGGQDLTTAISTRAILDAAGLIVDGFTLQDTTEIRILPYYSPEGGENSDRFKAKTLMQKFLTDGEFESGKLFDESDTAAV